MKADEGELGEITPHSVKTGKEVTHFSFYGGGLAYLMPKSCEHLLWRDGEGGEIHLVDTEGVCLFARSHGIVNGRVCMGVVTRYTNRQRCIGNESCL